MKSPTFMKQTTDINQPHSRKSVSSTVYKLFIVKPDFGDIDLQSKFNVYETKYNWYPSTTRYIEGRLDKKWRTLF